MFDRLGLAWNVSQSLSDSGVPDALAACDDRSRDGLFSKWKEMTRSVAVTCL